eukprot:UN09633
MSKLLKILILVIYQQNVVLSSENQHSRKLQADGGVGLAASVGYASQSVVNQICIAYAGSYAVAFPAGCCWRVCGGSNPCECPDSCGDCNTEFCFLDCSSRIWGMDGIGFWLANTQMFMWRACNDL